MIKEKAVVVIEILEEYGVVPDSLQQEILRQTDLSVLGDWITPRTPRGSAISRNFEMSILILLPYLLTV